MTEKKHKKDISYDEFEDISIENEDELFDSQSEVKKLKKQIKNLQKEKEEYLIGWQKERADMVNLKKQTEEEKKLFTNLGKESLLLEIIPVLDNFEAAFSNKEAWEKVDEAWRKGVEYIYTQFLSILENNGVSQFGEVGDNFDESKYLSIEVEKTNDESKDHTVSEVIQKGYTFKDKVIKEAKVKIFSFEN
ncbi:nucleotide exchange factor GrpE [Candidatus Campbellbacteria bacterium]|nr:MAG: nucleotide exchange factor GrpE [Candidatus Campbellbacteria bacterium]